MLCASIPPGRIQFGAILNKAAVNIPVQLLYEHHFLTDSGKCLGERRPDHVVRACSAS